MDCPGRVQRQIIFEKFKCRAEPMNREHWAAILPIADYFRCSPTEESNARG
jgi:hypothetical protein